MKIIWLTTIFDDSAVSNVLLRILPYMQQKNQIECIVVSLESHKKTYKALETLHSYNIKHISFDCKKHEIIKSKRKLQNLIKKEKPTIVHAQLGRAYIALLLAKQYHKKNHKRYYKLATFHNTAKYFNKLSYAFLKLFYHRFDGVSAVSQDCLRTIQDCFDKNHTVYAEVIYNPVPLPPKTDATTTTKEKGAIILAVVGRLIEDKGHDLWMDALPHIKKRFDEVPKSFEVWCVGEGDWDERIVRKCKELGFSDIVKMRGYVYNVYEIMAQSDVVLFPSQSEGFGLVPCEAILCGVPVVINDIPVMRELLDEDLFLTDCKNPQMFADTIYEIWSKQDVYQETLIRVQARLKKILAPQNIANDYMKFYAVFFKNSPKTSRR